MNVLCVRNSSSYFSPLSLLFDIRQSHIKQKYLFPRPNFYLLASIDFLKVCIAASNQTIMCFQFVTTELPAPIHKTRTIKTYFPTHTNAHMAPWGENAAARFQNLVQRLKPWRAGAVICSAIKHAFVRLSTYFWPCIVLRMADADQTVSLSDKGQI